MNDSFLEDLDLVPKNPEKINTQVSNKYITTRKVLSLSNRSRSEDLELKKDKIISSSSSSVPKSKVIRRSGGQETRKSSDSDSKPSSSTPKSDKKKYSDENCRILEEKKVKVDEPVKKTSRVQDIKSTKEHRYSGNSGCSSKCFESSSSKENTRPSTDGSSSSKEGATQPDFKKDIRNRRSDPSKKLNILENTDPIELLNAIKHLVTKCNEQENIKVLRSMQTLHINSQANLIKHLMHLKDDLVRDFNLNKNTESMKSLIEENERMREDIFILRSRNEVLQRKIDELVLIKEENTSLKLKLKELQQ